MLSYPAFDLAPRLLDTHAPSSTRPEVKDPNSSTARTPAEVQRSFLRARLWFITKGVPSWPGDYILTGGEEKLAEFCQGFTDRQLALVGMENSMAAQYKGNLAAFRKQAAKRAAAAR